MMKLLVVARGMHAANTTLAFRRMSAISVSFFPIWATLFAAPLRPTNQLLQLARLEFELELAALARQQPPPRRFPFASLVSVVARPRPRKPSCSVSLDTGNHLWTDDGRTTDGTDVASGEGEPTRWSELAAFARLADLCLPLPRSIKNRGFDCAFMALGVQVAVALIEIIRAPAPLRAPSRCIVRAASASASSEGRRGDDGVMH